MRSIISINVKVLYLLTDGYLLDIIRKLYEHIRELMVKGKGRTNVLMSMTVPVTLIHRMRNSIFTVVFSNMTEYSSDNEYEHVATHSAQEIYLHGQY